MSNKNTVILASAVAATGALSGCSTLTPQSVFQNEPVKITGSSEGLYSIQFLNYQDSVFVLPQNVEQIQSKYTPTSDGYYIASGTTIACSGGESGVEFTNLQEITKEQADSLRTTKTVNYVEEYKKQQAEKQNNPGDSAAYFHAL